MKKNTEFNLNLPKYDEEKNNELLPIYSKTKDVAILNELTLNNLRLISPFAYYYYKRYNLSYEDLFYEGIPGLIEGIKKFDCKVGSKLSTFVGFYIRNSIKKYIELNYKPVKYPIRLIRETKKVEAKIEELGENISNEELAAALGYSIERVILCRQLISNSISLDEVTRLNDDEDTSIELLKNTIVDEKVSPEQIALYNSQRKQLLFYLKRVLTKKTIKCLDSSLWIFNSTYGR